MNLPCIHTRLADTYKRNADGTPELTGNQACLDCYMRGTWTLVCLRDGVVWIRTWTMPNIVVWPDA